MWRSEVPAAAAKLEHDNLFQEIYKVYRQWTELERTIFSQAHYQGQSVETISCTLQLDLEEVNAILKQCDRQLHASLKSFRNNNCEKSLPAPAETVCPDASSPEGPHAFAFGVKDIPDYSQMSA